ncbi:MAG: VanZ family protein [Thermodesulfobacteriota bacterium]
MFLRVWDFLYYWLPPLLWLGAILSLSGDPGSANNTRIILNWLLSWFPSLSLTQVDLLRFYLRKTGHAVAYGFLYFLWFHTKLHSNRNLMGRTLCSPCNFQGEHKVRPYRKTSIDC